MRIIGLFGHGSCGKSSTLNILKELLRESSCNKELTTKFRFQN